VDKADNHIKSPTHGIQILVINWHQLALDIKVSKWKEM